MYIIYLNGQCGKVIVTLGRRFTNRHRYSGKTVNVRKGPPDKKTEAGVERWLLEEVPQHVILASTHALFSSFLFSFGECGENLALKVKKSSAVIIFLLALEHL